MSTIPTAANKIGNSYQAAFPCYSQTPKAVMAAILMSLAERLQGEGDSDAAKQIITEEWEALHESGVVPQKPIKPKPTTLGDIRPFRARMFEKYCIEKGVQFTNNEDGTVTMAGQIFGNEGSAERYLVGLN